MSRLAVLGSLNIDLVVAVARLPDAGETVLGGALIRAPGGKGGNQAVAAARLGADVVLLGAVGDDEHGRLLLDAQRAEAVDVSAVEVLHDIASGAALITVQTDGENTIAVAPGANARLDADLVDRHAPLLIGCDVLLLQLEVPADASRAAADRVHDADGLVVLNASPVPEPVPAEVWELLQVADVVVVNETEARALAGAGTARSWAVVTTLGARGARWSGPQGEGHAAAPRVEVVDAVGAGDAFAGALAVGLAEGRPLGEAVARACAAGALATCSTGAQDGLPTADALARLVSG